MCDIETITFISREELKRIYPGILCPRCHRNMSISDKAVKCNVNGKLIQRKPRKRSCAFFVDEDDFWNQILEKFKQAAPSCKVSSADRPTQN